MKILIFKYLDNNNLMKSKNWSTNRNNRRRRRRGRRMLNIKVDIEIGRKKSSRNS